MTKKLTLFLLVIIAAFPAHSTKRPQLNEPLFARIILSQDKTKVLPIILDKPQKDGKSYTVLITDKSCNGKLCKPYMPGMRTGYQQRIKRHQVFTDGFTAVIQ